MFFPNWAECHLFAPCSMLLIVEISELSLKSFPDNSFVAAIHFASGRASLSVLDQDRPILLSLV